MFESSLRVASLQAVGSFYTIVVGRRMSSRSVVLLLLLQTWHGSGHGLLAADQEFSVTRNSDNFERRENSGSSRRMGGGWCLVWGCGVCAKEEGRKELWQVEVGVLFNLFLVGELRRSLTPLRVAPRSLVGIGKPFDSSLPVSPVLLKFLQVHFLLSRVSQLKRSSLAAILTTPSFLVCRLLMLFYLSLAACLSFCPLFTSLCLVDNKLHPLLVCFSIIIFCLFVC